MFSHLSSYVHAWKKKYDWKKKEARSNFIPRSNFTCHYAKPRSTPRLHYKGDRSKARSRALQYRAHAVHSLSLPTPLIRNGVVVAPATYGRRSVLNLWLLYRGHWTALSSELRGLLCTPESYPLFMRYPHSGFIYYEGL